MRSFSSGWITVGAVLLSAGATGSAAADPAQFRLSSPAFADGKEIPAHFTCDGGSISPPLAWTNPPADTKSFALVVTDVDAPDPKAPLKPWIHWVVYAIPADVRGLDEGASRKLPPGSRNGRSDWKTADYGGPCPPVGKHRYVFELYALDLPPSNLGSPSRQALFSRIEPNVLGKARLTGLYARTPAAPKQP